MNADEMIDGLLNQRRDAARTVISAAAQVAAAQAALDEARKSYGDAYRAATDTGWTDKELGRMGAHRPANRAGGRTKGSRTKRSSEASQDTATASSPESS